MLNDSDFCDDRFFQLIKNSSKSFERNDCELEGHKVNS